MKEVEQFLRNYASVPLIMHFSESPLENVQYSIFELVDGRYVVVYYREEHHHHSYSSKIEIDATCDSLRECREHLPRELLAKFDAQHAFVEGV